MAKAPCWGLCPSKSWTRSTMDHLHVPLLLALLVCTWALPLAVDAAINLAENPIAATCIALAGSGAATLEAAFEREEITDRSVLHLTEAHFKELGVKMGPRMEILEYLRGAAAVDTAATSAEVSTGAMPSTVESSRRLSGGGLDGVSVLVKAPDGRVAWGPTADTSLGRAGANHLETPGAFSAASITITDGPLTLGQPAGESCDTAGQLRWAAGDARVEACTGAAWEPLAAASGPGMLASSPRPVWTNIRYSHPSESSRFNMVDEGGKRVVANNGNGGPTVQAATVNGVFKGAFTIAYECSYSWGWAGLKLFAAEDYDPATGKPTYSDDKPAGKKFLTTANNNSNNKSYLWYWPVLILQSTFLSIGRSAFHSCDLDFHSAYCCAIPRQERRVGLDARGRGREVLGHVLAAAGRREQDSLRPQHRSRFNQLVLHRNVGGRPGRVHAAAVAVVGAHQARVPDGQ